MIGESTTSGASQQIRMDIAPINICQPRVFMHIVILELKCIQLIATENLINVKLASCGCCPILQYNNPSAPYNTPYA